MTKPAFVAFKFIAKLNKPAVSEQKIVQLSVSQNIPFGFQGAGKALVGEGEGVYTEYMTEPESHEQHSQNLKGEGYRALTEPASLMFVNKTDCIRIQSSIKTEFVELKQNKTVFKTH